MKVLVLGLPKSGTSILTYRIFDAVPGLWKRLYFEKGARRGAEDVEFHRKICFTLRAVVSKNLIYPNPNTSWDSIFRSTRYYNRCVWIARDPRDIIISNYFYHWLRGHNSPDEMFNKALTLTRDKEQNPASTPFYRLVAETMSSGEEALINWQQSTYGYLTQQAGNINANCHVFHYEDMIEDRLDDLNDYLGFTVVNDVEIDNERKRIVRSKAYDNWRRWFTQEDVDFFKPVLSTYLDTMGYDADDWQLIEEDSLPAEEGSAYMTKLRNRDVTS